MSYLKQTTRMGTWKKRKLDKKSKRSFTTSNKGKVYIAIPPPGGWPGGTNYAANGARLKGGR